MTYLSRTRPPMSSGSAIPPATTLNIRESTHKLTPTRAAPVRDIVYAMGSRLRSMTVPFSVQEKGRELSGQAGWPHSHHRPT